MGSGWKKQGHPKVINELALGFNRLLLTIHAQQQMEIRGITLEDVLRTLRQPTSKVPQTQPGRQRLRWNKTARVAIDVVSMPIENELHIVTVIKVTRRMVER